MSSLQKFHRRTMSLGPVTWPATAIGGGDVTHGFWLGDISTNKLVVAPKSTEVMIQWGSVNLSRGTTSTTNGVANTNTLAGFGQAAHPAAYYCKNLTTGGYNTWYLPAITELSTMYSNKSATPFATGNYFSGNFYLSSTEHNDGYSKNVWFNNGTVTNVGKSNDAPARAVRRSTI